MKILKRFVLGHLATNCYLIEHNNKIILIDAGLNISKVVDYLNKHDLVLDEVWLTHTHYDHIGGLSDLKNFYDNLEIYVGEKEQPFLTDPVNNLSSMDNEDYIYTGPSKIICEEEFKNNGVKLFRISGHSLESICFYFEDEGILFSGDTLFRENIGRSDLPNGDSKAIIKGIKKHLLPLDPKTKVYTGHGFSTTIEHELEKNKKLKERG